MPRIRRKFALILCGVTIFIFLLVYVIINHAITTEKPNSELTFIENRIKQLENGLNKHHQEFGEIKKQINTIQQNGQQQYVDHGDVKQQFNKEMINDDFIKANRDNFVTGKCNLKTNILPQTDIQMLDLYRQLKFDNIDGGPWKQGWRVQYDVKNWNNHHKLKVFIVPHSHNDPGWLMTFDEYYERHTKQIFANMLRHLKENPKMKFIWAEICYFQRFYDKLTKENREIVKQLLKNRQLEFVTGGWVMPDEANSHWYSILLQLSEGQTWLKNNFNITPKSSWSIDPFGHSATMPFLLKKSGFENLLIQRTHYSVKKQLATDRNLEFRWRQLWDTTGNTDLLTHMMPFYSYDVPHTCGPDPKVCCQFDFKRLPGYGLTCPWGISPQVINEQNVAQRAELIIDQWRKKSVLYKTRSVLIPLGDDFRYTQSTEWEAQRTNFEKLFDYINNEPNLNIEVKFATLQEYFDSMRNEMAVEKFPSLTGDFFTYADRDDHYWSGYYTSRPFHKRQDRILMNYIRSAEMLSAWNVWESDTGFDSLLETARRALSLFQHHDGITGTARDNVVVDYANRMSEAIQNCKFVMQQSVYRLLTKSNIYQFDPKFHYLSIDDSRTSSGTDDTRPTIILGDELPVKQIVIHNSLPHERSEIVEFYIAKPFVTVTDMDSTTIPCQIAPVWLWHKNQYGSAVQPQASNTKYRLLFRATVPALGLVVYTINSRGSVEESVGATYSKVTILTQTPFTVNLNEYPQAVEFSVPRDVSLRVNEGPGISINSKGLLKSMSIDSNSPNVPVHLEFLKYGTRKQAAAKSGAYLFLPDGIATQIEVGNPTVLLTKGTLESSVTAGLPFAIHEYNLRGEAVEIRNLVDIGDRINTEIVMRMSTNIKSGDEFYTDLNGLQMIKRQRFGKIPLQANYYPVPSTMFIQDDLFRLTLLSAQPLGGGSLKSGEMEIMQDRRLNQDDDRGLGQGVTDNKPVLNIFKLILEPRDSCTKLDPGYPAAYHTSNSFVEMKSLLHPFDKFIYNENDWLGVEPSFGIQHESLPKSFELAVLRDIPHIKVKNKSTIGLVIHRTNFEDCSSSDTNVEENINIKKLLGIDENKEMFSTPLTLLKKQEAIYSDDIEICPMDIKAFVIQR
uniref:Alpha-mannosidase n=1 Tax=Corethrella appendiculata TaxID=1370023 RepID=U5EZM2_9DIPT